MPQRLPITVRLDSFEGPLDLLLYLIQSHELDISKVSISRITDQYLAYIRLMKELNFDTASEFLVMASTLLHWKSKSLLPDESKADAANAGDEPVMTQEELIRQLLEHQRFLAAGKELAQLPTLGIDCFKRSSKKLKAEKVWREMNITDLARGYQDLLVRARKRTTVLRKETVSLADKIREFKGRLTIGKLIEMKELVGPLYVKPEVVVTFLASLELSRLKKMRLHQEQTYGPILVELLESLMSFDENLASGFDQVNAPITAKAPTEGISVDLHTAFEEQPNATETANSPDTASATSPPAPTVSPESVAPAEPVV